jgi:ribonuclease D
VSERPTIIDNIRLLEPALDALAGPLAVDTEFHAEGRFQPELMWIQVADEHGRILLIDAQQHSLLQPTIQALGKHDLILHAGSHDLALLSAFGDLDTARIFDTQIAAGLLGLGYPRRLNQLLMEVLERSISKEEALSDWALRPPSSEQVHYAANDVAHLHDLAEGLEKRGAASSLKEPMRSLLEEALRPPDEEQLWREFRAAVVLDARGREVLRRAAIWRFRLAREQDRQPRQVCQDGALVDLAKRLPRDLESLAAPRNFSRKLRKQHGEALLECVRAALATPEEELPDSLVQSERQQSLSALLGAWAHHQAYESGIALRLLLPDRLRRVLAQAWASGKAPEFPAGWRRDRFQEDLDAIFGGDYRIGPKGLVRD